LDRTIAQYINHWQKQVWQWW